MFEEIFCRRKVIYEYQRTVGIDSKELFNASNNHSCANFIFSYKLDINSKKEVMNGSKRRDLIEKHGLH